MTTRSFVVAAETARGNGLYGAGGEIGRWVRSCRPASESGSLDPSKRIKGAAEGASGHGSGSVRPSWTRGLRIVELMSADMRIP